MTGKILFSFFCLLSTFQNTFASSKFNYTVVASEGAVPGNQYVVHLNLYNVDKSILKNPSSPEGLEVKVTLGNLANSTEFVPLTDKPTNISKQFLFLIPLDAKDKLSFSNFSSFKSSWNEEILSIEMKTLEKISIQKPVKLLPRKLFPIVLTNQNLFRVGEQMNFLFMVHYSDQTPYRGPVNIIIYNPKGVVVYRLVDENVSGIKLRKFLGLSKPGKWKIELSVEGEKVSKNFIVTEKAKKNFEVFVDLPTSLSLGSKELRKSKELMGNLEAVYFSGVPVEGIVIPRITLMKQEAPLTTDQTMSLSGQPNTPTSNSSYPPSLSSQTAEETIVNLYPIELIKGRAVFKMTVEKLEKYLMNKVLVPRKILKIQFIFINKNEKAISEILDTLGSTDSSKSSLTVPTKGKTTNSTTSDSSTDSKTTKNSTSNSTASSSILDKTTITNEQLSQILMKTAKSCVVNTTTVVVMTSSPFHFSFSDFTPNSFKPLANFTGYIVLSPYNEVNQLKQYFFMTPQQSVNKNLQYVDLISPRKVSLSIMGYATPPNSFPTKTSSSEVPNFTKNITISVIPSEITPFFFIPPMNISKITIEAYFMDELERTTLKISKQNIIVFDSRKTDLFQIFLDQPNLNITTGSDVNVKIKTTIPIDMINYELFNEQALVISGQKKFESKSGEENGIMEGKLKISLNSSMASLLPPAFRLLVWTLTPDNKVVADSLFLVVENQVPKKLNMTILTFSHSHMHTSDVTMDTHKDHNQVLIEIEAEPNSRVLIIGSSRPILVGEQQNQNSSTDFNECMKKIEMNKMERMSKKMLFSSFMQTKPSTLRTLGLSSPLSSHSISSPNHLTPPSSLVYSSLLSQLDFSFPSLSLTSPQTDSGKVFEESGGFLLPKEIIYNDPKATYWAFPEIRDLSTSFKLNSSIPYMESMENKYEENFIMEMIESMRNLPSFLELPLEYSLDLWKIISVGPKGKANFSISTNHESKLFTVSAFSFHPQKPIEVLEKPVQIEFEEDISLEVEGPEDVREEETIVYQLKLYNNKPNIVKTTISMVESSCFSLVCEGSLSSSLSHSSPSNKTSQKTVITSTSGKKTHTPGMKSQEYPVQFAPHELKTLLVTVKVNKDKTLMRKRERILKFEVETDEGRECSVEKIIRVEPYSEVVEKTSNQMVVLNSEKKEVVLETLEKEEVGTKVIVYRDLMSPLIENMCHNLEKEDYESGMMMIRYGISLQALPYVLENIPEQSKSAWKNYFSNFKKSKDVSTGMEEQEVGSERLECLKVLLEEFRRVFEPSLLTSNSSFPQTIWMSVETLNGISEWNETIGLEYSSLQLVVDRLESQQKDDGRFVEVKSNFALNRFKQFGNPSEDVPLTSYVIISLQKAMTNLQLRGETKQKLEKIIKKAVSYIEKKLEDPKTTHPYVLSIATYALLLSNSKQASSNFKKLQTFIMSVQNGEQSYKYISVDENQNKNPVLSKTNNSSSPTSTSTNTSTPTSSSPLTPHEASSLSVSASSYLLMIYLKNNDFESSSQTLIWIVSQLRPTLTFVNSEDTSVAVEGIRKYLSVRNKQFHEFSSYINITLPLSNSSNKTIPRTLGFGNSSKIDLTDYLKGQISPKLVVSGTGLILIQNKNQMKKTLPKNKITSFLEVDVKTDSRETGKDSSLFLNICTRHLKEYPSGPVFFKIPIPSGYEPNMELLRREISSLSISRNSSLSGSTSSKNTREIIRQVREVNGTVHFTLIDLEKDDSVCIPMKLMRKFQVLVRKPITIKVSPFYQMEKPSYSPLEVAVSTEEKTCSKCVCVARVHEDDSEHME